MAVLVVGQGTQFITGPCTNDTDCASACCGFNSGKCAGPIIAQERDGGCGFGDAQPNANAANALLGKAPASPTNTSAAVATESAANITTASAVAAVQTSTSTSSAAPGTQFITGPCTSDADCASSCCGFNSGKCAGPIIAQERDGGCGFGDAQPNAIAAKALGFSGKKRGLRFWA